MEPPSTGSISSTAPLTPFSSLGMPQSAPGNHGNTDIGPGTPLTVPNFPLQPLTSINTSIHSNFQSGSSPLESPIAGIPLSPHGGMGSKYNEATLYRGSWL